MNYIRLKRNYTNVEASFEVLFTAVHQIKFLESFDLISKSVPSSFPFPFKFLI